MDETTLGGRLREIRRWHQLSLREAAGAAGLSVSLWGQVERGDRPVASRYMLEAMARALRVHPIEVTGQPWAPQDLVSSEAHAGLWGIEVALERYELGVDPEDLTMVGDHELSIRVAEGLRPETHLLRGRQADYWVTYGQALARLRGSHEAAAQAFRRAEVISPHSVLRDPITREVLGELLVRSRRDSPAGQELRRMAYRAGLPV